MKSFLWKVLKFVVASILIGYGFWMWRQGILTSGDDDNPQANPGKMLGLFPDYDAQPGQSAIRSFGLYEIGFGVACTGLLFLAGGAMKMGAKMTGLKLLKNATPGSPTASAA